MKMQQKSKYGYLMKNTLIFTISSFGTKLLTFFLVPLYTNVLSTTDYGVADLLSTTATLLVYFFTICISESVLRFSLEPSEEHDRVFAYGLRILIQGSAILTCLLFIAFKLNISEWNWLHYVFLFLNFFFIAINQILSNYMRATERVIHVAIAGILTTLFTIISNVLFLLVFNLGIYGYLLSTIIGGISACVYSLYHTGVPKGIFKRTYEDQQLHTRMRNYSIPLIFNSVSWWVNSALNRYFISYICGAAQNGIYAVASKIPTILSVVASIFAQAWNLSAIKEFDKEDKDGFFANIYSVYNAGLVLVCSGLILFNIPLAKILFAKEFFVAWECSSILLISGVFSAISIVPGSVFAAIGDSRIYAVSTISAAIVNTILNILMIPYMGVIGASISTAISFFIVWAIRMICARKYIKWKLNLIRDLMAYLLLVMQVVFEHMNGHFYFGQIGILVILLVLYRKQIRSILNKGFSILKKKRS